MPKVNYRPRFWVNGAANVFNGVAVPFLGLDMESTHAKICQFSVTLPY